MQFSAQRHCDGCLCSVWTVVWCIVYFVVQSSGESSPGCRSDTVIPAHSNTAWSIVCAHCVVWFSAMQAVGEGEPGWRSDTVIAACPAPTAPLPRAKTLQSLAALYWHCILRSVLPLLLNKNLFVDNEPQCKQLATLCEEDLI